MWDILCICARRESVGDISNLSAIPTGADGALQSTNRGAKRDSQDGESIGRITTSGTVTNYTGTEISHPIDIAAGPDGALWYVNSADSIGRITTATLMCASGGGGIGGPACGTA